MRVDGNKANVDGMVRRYGERFTECAKEILHVSSAATCTAQYCPTGLPLHLRMEDGCGHSYLVACVQEEQNRLEDGLPEEVDLEGLQQALYGGTPPLHAYKLRK